MRQIKYVVVVFVSLETIYLKKKNFDLIKIIIGCPTNRCDSGVEENVAFTVVSVVFLYIYITNNYNKCQS